MADYPWGGMTPLKRITTLEAAIKSNEDKRAAAVEAHKKKIVEFDDNEKSLRADLRAATAIADKERKETNKAEAVRILERLASGGFDLDAAIKTGVLEKHLASAVGAAIEEAAKVEKGGSQAKAAPAKPATAERESQGAGGEGRLPLAETPAAV